VVRQLLLDPSNERLAELVAEPAADDHGLDVEQVLHRADARRQGQDGPLDQPLGQLVALVQRVQPDARRDVWPALPLLDLEELGLLAPLDLALRPGLHRGPPGVGLEAALVAAAAQRAAAPHDDVADLAGRAAAAPDLPVEDDPAADARAA